MIFLFGSKTVQRELPPERKVCPTCLSVTDHAVVDHDTRFTLYFIPLFSIKRDVAYTCLRCGDTHTIPYSEYQAAHPDAEAIREASSRTRSTRTTHKGENAREKARAVIEGKLVDGEIKTYKPFSTRFSPENMIRWMWIALALIAVLAILLLALLVSIISR